MNTVFVTDQAGKKRSSRRGANRIAAERPSKSNSFGRQLIYVGRPYVVVTVTAERPSSLDYRENENDIRRTNRFNNGCRR